MYFGLPVYRPAPCKDCHDRTVGCHGKCEKYLAYRAELDAINKKVKMEKSGADVAYEGIYHNRAVLKHTEAGRRALKQR